MKGNLIRPANKKRFFDESVLGPINLPKLDIIDPFNPAHITLTKDGGFITSEKGQLHRIKLHDADGGFVCYVAPPDALGEGGASFDVAVDSRGRVLALDRRACEVRIYEKKERADD